MRSAIVILFTSLFAAGGCAPSEARACNHECDCEGCSDREYDECLDDRDDDWATADRRNCMPEYRDLLACENATWVCDGNDYETDCGPEKQRYRDCVN